MPDLDRVIRRNTVLLAATLAVNSAVVQLVAAVSSLTFVLVTGSGPARPRAGDLPRRGRGPGAVAGRAMDRFGRLPVLIIGFLVGGSRLRDHRARNACTSTIAVIVGFVLTGSSSAAALLVRTAAGDMYPPVRGARGHLATCSSARCSGDPRAAVFGPLFAGKHLGPTR